MKDDKPERVWWSKAEILSGFFSSAVADRQIDEDLLLKIEKIRELSQQPHLL